MLQLGLEIVAGLASFTLVTAQDNATPGVSQVAPGVTQIDGAKVPSQSVDIDALRTTLATETSFTALKKLLGGNGVESMGPSGTTLHMYKVSDQGTKANYVVILFVKKGVVLQQMVTEGAPTQP